MDYTKIEDYDWTEPSMQEEDLLAETDIYSDSIVDKLQDDDEISIIEAAFMNGYNQAKDPANTEILANKEVEL